MSIRKIVFMAIFITMGIVLPIAFHFTGTGLGAIFLPMHIPVILCGCILGPFAGFIVGMVTPVLSSLLTGMPPFLPILPIMFFELSVYGLIIGYLFKVLHWNIYSSLLVTMVVGRITAGLVVWFLVTVFAFNLPANPLLYIWGITVKGFPGILIQLILIPLLARYLFNILEGNYIKKGFQQ